MKKLFTQLKTLLIILLVVPAFFSCEDEEEIRGTCEMKIKNYEDILIYTCKERVLEASCKTLSSDVQMVFYEYNTCMDLGYSYENSDGDWFYDQNNNVTPGPYGEWGN